MENTFLELRARKICDGEILCFSSQHRNIDTSQHRKIAESQKHNIAALIWPDIATFLYREIAISQYCRSQEFYV